MTAFPIHNFIQIDDSVDQLNVFDAAACNRVLELFATPYPDLTQAQSLMLERIRDASNAAPTPFRHIFMNEPTDDIPLANILHLNGSSEFQPLRNLAPFLKSCKSQHNTGHTNLDSVADQMRTIWKTFCAGREDGTNHIYTQQDVLEFVEWSNILVDDPDLGIPLISARGTLQHLKYNKEQQCWFQFGRRNYRRICLTPGCFRSEPIIISDQFPYCMQHYNDAIYVVLEISLPGETHPHRHVQYQVTINREWNNNKLMEYFQNVWLHRRSTYNPLRTDSSVTQAWIFENYQATIDKISSLQFCYILKTLNDSSYDYVTDQITLPINLQNQIGPILSELGITISLNGQVSDEELESIGLADLFGVEYTEEGLQESPIVLYRATNEHFEYRGLTNNWTTKKVYDRGLAPKVLLGDCLQKGYKFTHEPRRILLGREGMEKAEFLTIMGSAIMAYIHAPRPETGMDFVNVNAIAKLCDRGPISGILHSMVDTYKETDMDEDYSFEDEAAFYDGEHLTDLDLLQQWISNEYRMKVIITVRPDVELNDEEDE